MRYILFIFLFLGQLTFAQEDAKPLVKTKLSEMTERWVGQRVSFYVELYSPSWFSGTPRFEIPELDDAIIYKLPGSPVLGTVQIDGHSYSRQSYSFALFTRRPGKIDVPSFSVDFQVAVPGKKPLQVSLKSEPMSVVTNLPRGLQRKAFVTTDSFNVSETWDKNVEELEIKVGDALVRTIDRKAINTMAMLIPPIKVEKLEGVGIYESTPQLNDKVERGDFNCQRIEKFTYVFEEEGEFLIPEVKLYSWDPKSKEMKEHHLPEVKLKVAPNPAYEKGIEESQQLIEEEISLWPWISLIILGIIAFFCRNLISQKWQTWSYAQSQKESTYFQAVGKVSQENDTKEFYRVLTLWLNRLQGGSQLGNIQVFVSEFGSEKLKELYTDLSKELFTNSSSKFNSQDFFSELKSARKNYFLVQKTFKQLKRNPFQLSKGNK